MGCTPYENPETAFRGWERRVRPEATTSGSRPGELSAVFEALAWSGNAHAQQKLNVAAGFFEFVEDQFHCFDRGNACQRATENDNFVVFIRVIEEFLFAGAGALDIDRGENASVHQGTVEVDFHVAGAFELFKDDFIHARAGIDERGRNDGERAAFFDVTGCP